ncbi:MAG: hypoxanthine phosphoribosyltransferase [Actinomycetia bacterium]|nr:hypoxanthine phosphoribosyltransferase [Actinomycetes bacterium]
MELVDLYTPSDIAAAVKAVARDIAKDYRDRDPLLVGVMNGSFIFLGDLVREMHIPCEIDFIRARSYGASMESSGAVEITKDIEHDVQGRHVIVVEDILDTGLTIQFVTDRIRVGQPATVATCALLTRVGRPAPDYWGLEVPKGFVVGYGIDYAEKYRWLPSIKTIAQEES